ncbi:hypothetical protein GCM10009001_09200 [Virgibacillus siamensis]|uniref:Uncharacterized protein n=1 Tax=Virgibacillus siamensis TaxID=480071 RepID=A0ABP3QQ45_9BACI
MFLVNHLRINIFDSVDCVAWNHLIWHQQFDSITDSTYSYNKNKVPAASTAWHRQLQTA